MLDKSNVGIMSHILIRDPDTDETILHQRDATIQAQWSKCHVGSCHRHQACMYQPCRSAKNNQVEEITDE